MGFAEYEDLSKATHKYLLARAIAATVGPILELGCGPSSTLLIHKMAVDKGRFVRSVDTHGEWLREHRLQCCGSKRNPNHVFTLIDEESWPRFSARRKHWSVVLVDQAPAQARGEFLKRIDKALDKWDLVIVHDTEPESRPEYDFNGVFEQFRYVYHDTRFGIWATLVSNNRALFNRTVDTL